VSRCCPKCQSPLVGDNNTEFCPVCMLRIALSATLELGEEELRGTARPDPSGDRFEHYELVLRDDGKPLELGRGAMGVTFKAIDVNLRRPVALKVVKARYLGDAAMRQRFVDEARAAASLRHPNVASVFHLGKTGEDYFYAMEFVEGEPLERVLRYRGPLAVGLALDILDQVAAALSAAYRQNLVHRDIKPGNLMVTFGEGGRVTTKVIDFGLARPIRSSAVDPRLSEAGAFIGTPHFASPEQCAGKKADIRSDLYSLGVTFWVMLTGKVPFEGSTTLEVLEKQQHEAPPLEKLEHVPRPIVSLVESLLQKDPALRPQTPFQLQSMIREVGEAVEAGKSRLGSSFGRVNRKAVASRRGGLLISIILLLGAALAAFYFVNRKIETHIDTKSVAVMPFDNVGDDKQKEYFGDGLTTEVIFQLTKISDMRVISRDSVLRYKAVLSEARRTLVQIGEDLQVATILESSVQRAGNRVKIVSILYDARTGLRLWSESYDREIKDLFAIQADVAENIAAALQVRLSSDERARLDQKPTDNPNAYDLYLRGLALWQLRHKDDNEEAVNLFRQALEQDPKFALAYVALANAYVERPVRFGGEAFWLDSAINLCQQAIAIDPKQARAYIVLARAFTSKNRPDQAQAPIRKALQLAPNDAEANFRAGSQLPFIDPEAYAFLRKSYALNPNDPRGPYLLAYICAYIGDKDLMEKWMQRAINREIDAKRVRLMESERLILRGDYKAALAGLRQLPDDLVAYGFSVLELTIGCLERAGDWSGALQLANTQAEKDPVVPWLFFDRAYALRALGQESDAVPQMSRLMSLEKETFANNEKDTDAGGYLALASRSMGQKEEAYQYLRSVFPAFAENLPLLWANPALDLFAKDPEFKALRSDFETKAEKTRARIHEIEKT
jgi:serine/threonine protein kinase/Tfp pilus assembly protein PilF